jgi:hypothetical protein
MLSGVYRKRPTKNILKNVILKRTDKTGAKTGPEEGEKKV